MNRIITYSLLLTLLIGCTTDKQLDGKSYLAWVKSPAHQLKQEKELGGIKYTVQYKPYEFIVLNEEKAYSLEASLLTKRKAELAGMSYYNIRIATANNKDLLNQGVSDKAQYTKRLNYLSYDFQHDIQLETAEESVACSLYHFVQGHGVVPYIDMVVGFTTTAQAVNQTLIINDQVFGNGKIKFYIDKTDIKNVPELITI